MTTETDGVRPVFIVDTNVLIDYPDIIPNGVDALPDEPTIDTTNAHIIVPDAVIHELSKFKNEKSHRGEAAREILRRIRRLTEGSELRSQEEVYKLGRPIRHKDDNREFSVLPVDQAFAREVQWFKPSDQDMDDRIILTALYAKGHIKQNCNMTLLTNDNGLAICAAANGIKTSRYGYKYPVPYTGRRDNVQVPFDLYHLWNKDHQLGLDSWQKMMPDEPELVANEFIIMNPLGWSEYIKPCNNIGCYDAERELIVPLKYAYKFPWAFEHPGHACYAEALYNPRIKMVVVSGVAGTGKTYMGTVYAYEAMKNGDYLWAAAVIQTKENDGIGYRKGRLTEKLDLNTQPMKLALRNYFLDIDDDDVKGKKRAMRSGNKRSKSRDKKPEFDNYGSEEPPDDVPIGRQMEAKVATTWANWFNEVPVPYAKGFDFRRTVAVVDEVQDLSDRDADMVLKRPGRSGKIIFAGDLQQIHNPLCDEYNNGLSYITREEMGDKDVAFVSLHPEEVMREGMVKRLTQRQQAKWGAVR